MKKGKFVLLQQPLQGHRKFKTQWYRAQALTFMPAGKLDFQPGRHPTHAASKESWIQTQAEAFFNCMGVLFTTEFSLY